MGVGVLALLALCSLPVAGHDVDIEALSNRIAANPERTDLLLKRARVYRLNGHPEAALADIEWALVQDADDPDMRLEQALALSALGRDIEAEALLDDLVANESGELRWAALSERGVVRGRNGKLALAIEDLTEVIGKRPALQLYLARGDFQEAQGYWAEAAAGYRDGLARLGAHTRVLKERLIEAETARGNYAAALDLVDEQIALAPVKTEWLLRRADLLDLMGSFEQAAAARQEALNEANRVLGKRATALNRLARAKVYVALDRYEEANCDLQATVEQAPRLQEAQNLLDEVQWKANNTCTN